MTDKKNTSASLTKLEGFTSIEEMKKWATTIIDSGLLPGNISEPEQVITIVQHGKELGLPPHVAMNNIHVIDGRPSLSSSILGALLKRAGIEWTIDEDFAKVKIDGKPGEFDRRTTYKFFWKSKVTGLVIEAKHSVTWNQLTLAGYTTKQNYAKYPKEMMRARTLSSAVRSLFPEILVGMHTDIELNDISTAPEDLKVNEAGDIVYEAKVTT